MKKRTDPRPGSQPLSSIMTSDVVVVRDTLNVELLTRFLLERHLTCAAVSDEKGTLVGYVSMIDLVRDRYINGETENNSSSRLKMTTGFKGELRSGFHLEPLPRATVSDIMMPFVLRLPGNAPIDQAAALMAAEGVHRVLVVSPSNKVIGIVSALDVLRWVAKRDGYALPENTKASWRRSCEYATA